ncbi:MAG: hypothetical protein HYU74_05840 [Dechloromonas sp.]|nr:hypothetical protein [Dechloromonas sp.]
MIKSFLAVFALFGCIGASSAQQAYGPQGGSVQGREYWFNQEGQKEAFQKDLHATMKKFDRFPSCDMQRVLMKGRWQVCRQCGVVTKQSAPEMSFSYPVECL